MTGIIGAMKIEIEALNAQMENRQTKTVSGIEFTSGTLCGREAVTAVCGIGKVFAAMCAQTMILLYSPDRIINTGVAGSLSTKLNIGDIAVSDFVVEHDMDTSPLGDPVGMISGINIVDIPADGELADKAGEVALEKRYCEENNIKIGDKITLADTELTVTGIGSVPDYDMPVKNISDASAESSGFGLAFVSGDQYDAILSAGGQKAEDLSYSYVLKNGAEDKEIKELLRSFDFDYSAVEDQYFKETAEDTVGKKEDIEEGVADLNDGAKELYEGLNELKASSGSLTEGMNALFETCLAQANQSLAASGVKAELTADNYATANTCSKRYHYNVTVTFATTLPHFSKSSNIGIITSFRLKSCESCHFLLYIKHTPAQIDTF